MSETWNTRVTFSGFQRMSRRSVLSGWVGKGYSRKKYFGQELFHCLSSSWPLLKTCATYSQTLRTTVVFTPEMG